MRAAVLVGYGGVDQLELRDVPEPQTAAGQIKIRVVGASVNPIDWKLREGAIRPGLKLELPAIVRRAQKDAAVVLGAEGVVALDDDEESGRLPVLDGIADTVGPATTQKLLERVRPGATLASVVGEPPGAAERGLEVRHVWARPDPERLASMVRAVAEGTLVIPIARRYPLSDIRKAHEAAEKGAGGKVLLRL